MLKKMFVFMLSVLSFCCGPQVAAAVPQALTGIFAHGVGGKAAPLVEQYGAIFGPLVGRDGPEWDAGVHGSSVGRWRSCLAQQGDIDVIVAQLEERLRDYSGAGTMLVGVSKGAATMFNTIGYCAEHRPDLLAGLRLVVFDSPFRSPESAARQIAYAAAGGVSGWIPWLAGSPIRLIGSLMPDSCSSLGVSAVYRKYDWAGVTPERSLDGWRNPAIDRDMVIIFIHSQEDAAISVNDSRYLYRELLKLGYKNVYLIEAKRGRHGAVLWDHDKDAIYYCLDAIYQRHGFSSSSSSVLGLIPAIRDRELDRVAKPTLEEVAARIAGRA